MRNYWLGYLQNNFISLPFGLNQKKIVIKRKTLLWYFSIYPWFALMEEFNFNILHLLFFPLRLLPVLIRIFLVIFSLQCLLKHSPDKQKIISWSWIFWHNLKFYFKCSEWETSLDILEHYNYKAMIQNCIIVFFTDFLILLIVDFSEHHCQWVQLESDFFHLLLNSRIHIALFSLKDIQIQNAWLLFYCNSFNLVGSHFEAEAN